MGAAIRTKQLRIGNMTCISCQNKIEKKLGNTAGIEGVEVSYREGTAVVTFDSDIISYKKIIGLIETMDYEVLQNQDRRPGNLRQVIGGFVLILSLFLLVEQSGLFNLLVPGQLVDDTMGYGMLFFIGLITSVHCIAMCGGINLSQCIPKNRVEGIKKGWFTTIRPAFLYNMGRVISYTAVGFLVGALGSVVTFSNTLQGVLKLAAGVFMVIMGINMLGLFPWLRKLNPRIPAIFAKRIDQKKSMSSSPFLVGLLNGFMPCGPLQAMQLYALSTGNPFSGAFSMFMFSMGTVPLMFGLGAVSTVLGKRFSQKVMMVGGVLVVVLGMSMFSQGSRLAGMQPPNLLLNLINSRSDNQEVNQQVTIKDGIQIVKSTLSSGRYPNIHVQANIPVRWVIDAPKGSINGCNNRMLIRDFGIEYSFQTGENVIEFTPTSSGKISYSCWMGMIRGSIYVTEEGVDGGEGKNHKNQEDYSYVRS